jgi:hypothetical protein
MKSSHTLSVAITYHTPSGLTQIKFVIATVTECREAISDFWRLRRYRTLRSSLRQRNDVIPVILRKSCPFL